jgi:hypothetical protein
VTPESIEARLEELRRGRPRPNWTKFAINSAITFGGVLAAPVTGGASLAVTVGSVLVWGWDIYEMAISRERFLEREAELLQQLSTARLELTRSPSALELPLEHQKLGLGGPGTVSPDWYPLDSP